MQDFGREWSGLIRLALLVILAKGHSVLFCSVFCGADRFYPFIFGCLSLNPSKKLLQTKKMLERWQKWVGTILQITVQLKFLSLARDFCPVSTKVFRKPQKSFGCRNGEIILIPTYDSAPAYHCKLPRKKGRGRIKGGAATTTASSDVVFRSLYERELTGNFGFKFLQPIFPWEEELIVFRSWPNSIASNWPARSFDESRN